MQLQFLLHYNTNIRQQEYVARPRTELHDIIRLICAACSIVTFRVAYMYKKD